MRCCVSHEQALRLFIALHMILVWTTSLLSLLPVGYFAWWTVPLPVMTVATAIATILPQAYEQVVRTIPGFSLEHQRLVRSVPHRRSWLKSYAQGTISWTSSFIRALIIGIVRSQLPALVSVEGMGSHDLIATTWAFGIALSAVLLFAFYQRFRRRLRLEWIREGLASPPSSPTSLVLPTTHPRYTSTTTITASSSSSFASTHTTSTTGAVEPQPESASSDTTTKSSLAIVLVRTLRCGMRSDLMIMYTTLATRCIEKNT